MRNTLGKAHARLHVFFSESSVVHLYIFVALLSCRFSFSYFNYRIREHTYFNFWAWWCFYCCLYFVVRGRTKISWGECHGYTCTWTAAGRAESPDGARATTAHTSHLHYLITKPRVQGRRGRIRHLPHLRASHARREQLPSSNTKCRDYVSLTFWL
jgi:hypothetical protein